MPISNYRARLAERIPLTDRFIEMHFELVEPTTHLAFQAGQYVMLKIPNFIHTRSYSIVNPPSIDHEVIILLDIQPNGMGVQYLQSLKLGDEVEFKAPVGLFVVPPVESAVGQLEKEIMFIATASGVAPIKSQLEDLLISRQDERVLTLLFGLRHESDQFWYDELQGLAQEHQNFSFQPVLSQPEGEWPFHKGRVTDVIRIQDNFANKGYYLCGSNAMILDVRHLLMEKGVDAHHIHTEIFY